jgi:hypothetical protein
VPKYLFMKTTDVKTTELDNPQRQTPKARRKYLWLSLVLSVGLFTLLNLLTVWLEPYFLRVVSYTQQHSGEKVTLYKDQPTQDVIFMGSSRVLYGLDPAVAEQEIVAQTGVRPRILNMAIPSSGFDMANVLLKNIIADGKKPPVIVYGLSEFELNKNVFLNRKDNSAADTLIPYIEVLLRFDDFDQYKNSTLDKRASFVLSQLFPLFRDHKLILEALNIQFNSENRYHPGFESGPNQLRLPPDGYIHTSESDIVPAADAAQHAKDYKEDLSAFTPELAGTTGLSKFLSFAKAQGIKVFLINMPVTAEHLSWWDNNQNIELYSELARTVAQQNDVPFLDLYQKADQYFSPENFYDSNHLRDSGSKILTQMITRNFLLDYFKNSGGTNPAFYRAKLANPVITPRLTNSTRYYFTVDITNQSKEYWSVSGTNSVQLSYHWLNKDGSIQELEGRRTSLAYTIAPSQTANIHFAVNTPAVAGEYTLELDLVQGQGNWFGDRGSQTLRKIITIT